MPSRRRLVQAAVLLLGLTLTVGLFAWARLVALRDFQGHFQIESSSEATHIRAYLETRILFLDDLARHLSLVETPSPADFRAFVAAEQTRAPGIQALEWVPRVLQPQGRARTEAELPRAGGRTRAGGRPAPGRQPPLLFPRALPGAPAGQPAGLGL